MIKAASIPPEPFKPTATITTEARIKVISVIPLTGLLPTMAMALAATVVNRKAMTVTSRIPTTANSRLSITPNQKKRKVMRMVTTEPMAMILKAISRCVLSRFLLSLLPPFISLVARLTALLMMPQLFTIPMIPAMAIPPIPIDLA